MKILLAVSGSISAYRALDLCRNLVKSEHQVKVILTKGAEQFVLPNVFHYLGAKEVYKSQDDFNMEKSSQHSIIHIELAKWCDKFIIAPASANTLAKLAGGLCDDLLTSVFLALGNKDCAIFPAMNTNMLNHPMTQNNLENLAKLGHIFIHPPTQGELACGDIGQGKLPAVELMSEIIPLIHTKKANKHILITTGATIAPLDPIRYLTNPSSGLTGFELAKKYLAQGHKVTLIYGHGADLKIQYLKELSHCEIIEAKTTKEMLKTTQKYFDQCDIYISTAAMSDIEFSYKDHKVKKDSLEDALPIQKAPDVLKTLMKNKKNQKIVGFAAETKLTEDILSQKWQAKPVDLLVGNCVNNGGHDQRLGFGQSENEYFFFKAGKIIGQQFLTKAQLAQKIMDQLND